MAGSHTRSRRSAMLICADISWQAEPNRRSPGETAMKLTRYLLLAILALAGPSFAEEPAPVAKPEQLGFSSARLQRLTDAYQGYVDRGELPGAVLLIARGDKIAYLRAIGYQDREKQTLMKTDAIFRLASMTKPIVSVAVMMLVEEGKIDPGAPVSKYIPEFADLKVGIEATDPATGKPALTLMPQKRPMIVQDLLRHTAGLVYGQFGDKLVHQAYREAKVGDRNDTLPEMIAKLSKLPLAHQPGEVWEYSVAVDVLGRIVEVASGQGLDTFIAQRVTKPLGMTSTGFYVAEAERERIAQPQADATGQKPAMFDPTVKPKLFSGGGGMISTAGDYLRLCEMFLNGGKMGETQFLAPSTVALMTANALKPS